MKSKWCHESSLPNWLYAFYNRWTNKMVAFFQTRSWKNIICILIQVWIGVISFLDKNAFFMHIKNVKCETFCSGCHCHRKLELKHLSYDDKVAPEPFRFSYELQISIISDWSNQIEYIYIYMYEYKHGQFLCWGHGDLYSCEHFPRVPQMLTI